MMCARVAVAGSTRSVVGRIETEAEINAGKLKIRRRPGRGCRNPEAMDGKRLHAS